MNDPQDFYNNLLKDHYMLKCKDQEMIIDSLSDALSQKDQLIKDLSILLHCGGLLNIEICDAIIYARKMTAHYINNASCEEQIETLKSILKQNEVIRKA